MNVEPVPVPVRPARERKREKPAQTRRDTDGSFDRGSYRTLCVRTCDGFYFPISEAAGRSRFDDDAALCNARCPGTQTRLFAHRNGEDSETAVSTDGSGEVYTRIPNALLYRSRVVPGCACGPVDAASLPKTVDKPVSIPLVENRVERAMPRPKPEPGEDPETIMNARIDFDPVPLEFSASASKELHRQRQTIRSVGPKFFADR